ncbi:MAG: hypothetical protein AAF791_09990 [Bacteroidota bacterium]
MLRRVEHDDTLRERWDALPADYRERVTLGAWRRMNERYRASVERDARRLHLASAGTS